MRSELFLIILASLLLLAMLLTVRYGKEHSRHGYGYAGPGFNHIPG